MTRFFQFVLTRVFLIYAHWVYLKVQVCSRFNRGLRIFAAKILRFSLNGRSLLEFLANCQPGFHGQRKQLLETFCSENAVNIVFTFRTLHFLDWFAPVHLALERLYPEKYHILYVDYATTLHRIGSGLEYFVYREQVQSRMIRSGINPLLHFSHEEIPTFNSFPQFSAGITCEAIRQEQLNIPVRFYLPHYILPKKSDQTLPVNIRFDHVFLPTRPPYSYSTINNETEINNAVRHETGYPKECLKTPQKRLFPDAEKPVIIFAPSLDIKLLKHYIKNNLLSVLKKNPQWNFVVKLHPSLESRRHYMVSYMKLLLTGLTHVRFDTLSDIRSLSDEAALLITDFGSVGGEFVLMAGKPVIYLTIPKKYEGGADLTFRDHFADAVCGVEALPEHIERLLLSKKLHADKLTSTRQKVLSCTEAPDERAAEIINRLLT